MKKTGLSGSVASKAPVKSKQRIGEVAREVGVTTRTLRYWQEIALIAPSGCHDGGEERLYTSTDVARALHVKELQSLFGFTLAEIKVILNTEGKLADIKSAYRSNDDLEQRRRLVEAALETTVSLIAQIDDKVTRISSYRNELAAKAERLQARVETLI